MEPTLGESLAVIFGTGAPPTESIVEVPAPAEPEESVVADIANLIEEAQLHYNQAQQHREAGDWAGYGEELDALEAVLVQLAELTAVE